LRVLSVDLQWAGPVFVLVLFEFLVYFLLGFSPRRSLDLGDEELPELGADRQREDVARTRAVPDVDDLGSEQLLCCFDANRFFGFLLIGRLLVHALLQIQVRGHALLKVCHDRGITIGTHAIDDDLRGWTCGHTLLPRHDRRRRRRCRLRRGRRFLNGRHGLLGCRELCVAAAASGDRAEEQGRPNNPVELQHSCYLHEISVSSSTNHAEWNSAEATLLEL
jgi:hypothetical protein